MNHTLNNHTLNARTLDDHAYDNRALDNHAHDNRALDNHALVHTAPDHAPAHTAPGRPPAPTPRRSAPAPASTGPSRRWPRALLHGCVSGAAAFVFLLVVVGALPLSDGAAALAFFVSLVVPPAVVAHRLLPRPQPRPRPRPRQRKQPLPGETPATRTAASLEAERAVTQYGELLLAHPYSPGPSADAEELADYQTALDAYEQAKRSGPAQVPAILADGRAALERLRTGDGDTPDIAWSRGEGTMRLRLPRPAPGLPAVLVFETDVAQRFTVHARSGRGGRRQLLLDGLLGPTSAQITVPPQDGDSLLVEVTAGGPWRLALRPISTARRLTDGGRLSGRGPETVLKRGGSRVVEFEHRGDTAFTVRQLTRSFRPGELLAEGRGDARLTVPVPGRCVLRVDTTGDWTLLDPGN
ncbi:hypothetical protein [Streptomyces sp. NPDC002845]